MFMTKIKLLGAVVLAGTAIAVAAPSSRMMRSQANAQQSQVARPGAKNPNGVNRRVVKPPQGATTLKYGDGKADGKQSLGGSGEMIKFSIPQEQFVVAGLRIHASRYGQAQPPRESFLIYFVSSDEKRILHTEMVPYSRLARGSEQWVELKFERLIDLRPEKEVWVVIDFRAHQTKGAYVSYDKSTGGKHSRVGLPGLPSAETRFGGDWLIELILGPPLEPIET
jgi:hypothetical protein